MEGCELFLLGDDAVAIRPADRGVRHPLARALRETGDWIDVVVGKDLVAVRFDPEFVLPSSCLDRITSWFESYRGGRDERAGSIDLHIDTSPACAPDLLMLADRNSLTPKEFLARVLASDLTVDMLGFMPGFAYVEGVDPALRADRLSTPRQRLEAGSVGLLNGQLGLYGLAGPGGWPIIGRLTETLFDPTRDVPFLLQEGQTIRLIRAGG